MGLFDPVWMTKSEKKIDKAVEYVNNNITDEETLIRVITESRFQEIGMAAYKKLDNDEDRFEALKKTNHWKVQKAALNDITDEEILLHIIYELAFGQIEAIEKLKDDEDRKKIIKDFSDRDMVITRIHEIQDAALKGISDIACIDDDTFVSIRSHPWKERLIKEISDEKILIKIFYNDSDSIIRSEVLKKITDESVAVAALKDKDKWVREEAALHIIDNDILADYLANNGTYNSCAWEARIDSFTEKQLKLVAENREGHCDITKYACGKLGHQIGEKCRCKRCYIKPLHDFDAEGVCKRCGGRKIKRRKDWKFAGKVYMYDEHVLIQYPDGKEDFWESERVRISG